MTLNAWASSTTLPLTSWADGALIYVSATPMPMTPAQARAAGQRLLELADHAESGDRHAPAVARMDAWLARSGPTCLICSAPMTRHGICNACSEMGRRLDEGCDDCCVAAPCICEIGLSREQVLRELDGRR